MVGISMAVISFNFTNYTHFRRSYWAGEKVKLIARSKRPESETDGA